MTSNKSKTSKKVSRKEKDEDYSPNDPANDKREYKRFKPQVIIELTLEKRAAL